VSGGTATSGTITGVLVGNVTVRAKRAALTTADTSFTVTTGPAAAVVYVSPDTSNLGSGSTRTFTAKVVDAAGNTVTGYVGDITFAAQAGPGTVTGLPSGPITVVGGTATSGTLTGALIGNVTVRASSGGLTTADTSFTVTPRPTTTAVSFNPGPTTVMIAQASTLMVTVTDAGAGTQSAPGGTVALSSSPGGDLFGTCTLSATNPATCTVKVWPQSGGSTHTITATFAATDGTHAGSDSTGLPLGLAVINRRMCNLQKCN
jgi:hypothetical protein